MDKKLAKLLEENGISTRNKAVRSYAANGITGSYALAKLASAAEAHPNINRPLAYAMVCANRQLNGGTLPRTRKVYLCYVKDQIDWLVEHPDMMLDSYYRVRKQTLDYYEKAVKLIDEFKERA